MVASDSLTQPLIVSLGGSLLFPEDIDTEFIQVFKTLIEKQIVKGKRFIFVVGGGKVCRTYQAAARTLSPEISADMLDWVGIHTTRMNAQFMQAVFGELASEVIVTDPHAFHDDGKPIIIGAGWKPGWSTDYVAVEIAVTCGAQTIINMSNIDYVYESDPKQNLNAKKIEALSWADYRALIPKEWSPGSNTPFDPIASARAHEHNCTVIIIGRDSINLEQYLNGEDFRGTTIS